MRNSRILMNGNFRKNFIPINDNMDKLEAFVPSLNKDWRDRQRIKNKPFQIETLDVIKGLRDEGWKIKNVNQSIDRNRRADSHIIKMNHPDFTLGKGNAKEGYAELLISNSCNGSSPLNMDIGMFREICTNGMVAFDTIKEANTKVKHIEKDFNQLEGIIMGMNIKTQGVMEEFAKLKERDLTPSQMMRMAEQAAILRFEGVDFDPSQLLKVNRNEDRGNSLWSVYNTIQENLTSQNKLYDNAGKAIGTILSAKEDLQVNKELFNLVHAYA